MGTYKDLENLLQGFVDKGLPGCAIQIAKGGKTLYEGYFGYADLENKTPVTKNTVFRLASMSKLPLYTTMMMLYEQGKFLMTDPISDYLPEWKESKKFVRDPNGDVRIVPTDRPIIIRDAMSMKCGLPYCHFDVPYDNPTLNSMRECMKPLWEKGRYTLQEHVAAMSKAVLAFEPGTHWLYGFSSEITAALIEKLTDKPIDDAFKDMIFDPLGMDNTRSVFFGDIPQRLVKLYAPSENGPQPIENNFDSNLIPGPEHDAGWRRLFSNVNDYTKLMSMLANGGVYEGVRLIGRKTIDLMRSNGLTPEQQKDFDNVYENGYGYGYGVRTLTDKAKGNLNGSLGAFGWTGGFGSWCEADPEEGVSIVYMHNMMPNMERYYHPRIRVAAYGCLE